ncbi:MAG: response regulator transcription factor [Sulfurimonas sp.]|jgi:DNA-binding response OmpR family regulator
MQSTSEILKTLNILYAEDDESTRKNTIKTLSLFAGHVFEADNGADALRMFQKKNIHIVILDYVMPFIDGYAVALEIRKTDPDIPIIITSSFTEKEKLLGVIGFNLVSYLEKPLQFNDLMKSLKQSVERLSHKGKLKIALSEEIVYDSIRKQLLINGAEEPLTKNEYLFLEILLAKRSMLVMTEYIEECIYEGSVAPNTLRNMVYRLRKKLPVDLIVTIKEIGYMLKPL